MLWTISDLHLSFAQPKPMDIFGERWRDHPTRIARAWRALVAEGDLVLLAGDISWAMKLPEALVDLRWIDELPGQKAMIKGNHDYWWDRIGPLRPHMPPSITPLEASAAQIGDVVVCGTRGWITPETPGFTAADTRVYERELGRLDRALAAAIQLAEGAQPIVALIHFPPFLNGQPTEFAHKIAQAGASACVYGHLHRPQDWALAVQGTIDGVFYQLTSCDYLGFTPVAVRGINSIR
jgi:hypothetical protein